MINISEEISLQIPITADPNPFMEAMSNVQNTVRGSLEGIKMAFGAVGLMAAGFLKGAIDEAMEGQTEMADLEQTIKSTGKAAGLSAEQIADMADELSRATHIDGGEIVKGQNMLLTFTNIQGAVFKEASEAMLDLSTKMKTGPSQTAIQLGKALNDPIKGVTALTRVGVTFTDQQKEQIKAMQDAGNMAGAQRVILAELNKEFGGQALAAGQTYSGQLKGLANTFNDIKESIGTFFLPYLQRGATALQTMMDKIKDLSEPAKAMIATVLALAAGLGILVGGLSIYHQISTIVGPAIQTVTGALAGMSFPIIAVIAGIAALTLAYTQNFGGLKTFVDGVVGKISAAFGEAKKVFQSTHSIAEGLKQFLWMIFGDSNIFEFMKNMIDKATQIGGAFQKVFKALVEGKSISGAFWAGFREILGENIAGKISQVIGVVEYSIKGLIKFLKGDLAGAKNMFFYIFGEDDTKYEASAQKIVNVLVFVRDVISQMIAFMVNHVQTIVAFVVDNWPKIQSTITTVITTVSTVVQNVIKPLVAFIAAQLGFIVNWVMQNWPLIQNTITIVFNTIKAIVTTIIEFVYNKIVSVLTAIVNFWNNHGATIMAVVNAMWNNIKIVIQTAIHVVADIISAIMNVINGNWRAAWDNVVSAVRSILSGVAGIVRNSLSALGSVFSDIASSAYNWGANLINGFVDGIRSKIQSAKNAVGDVMSNIKKMIGFNSPSEEGEGRNIVNWGSNMISGFMDGVKAKLPDMHKLMNTAIKAPDLKVKSSVDSLEGALLTGNTSGSSPVTINFNGSYSFANKEDINYFMNQAALAVKRRK